MSRKLVAFSDFSGQEVPDQQVQEVIVVDYPGVAGPVHLDASKEEVERLRRLRAECVLIELPGEGGNERLAVEAARFNELFTGDARSVIEAAEPVAASPAGPAPKRQRQAGPSRADNVDHAAPENAGVVHRGRVTEAEAGFVRANLAQANANRARHGQPQIDPRDPKDAARYGFDAASGG